MHRYVQINTVFWIAVLLTSAHNLIVKDFPTITITQWSTEFVGMLVASVFALVGLLLLSERREEQ